MKFEKQSHPAGELAILTELSGLIENTGDFLDVLGSGVSETLVLRREHLTPGFFDLSTGIAGDMLQKVSNYSRRLVVIGDFNSLGGEALKAFIRESNRTGRVVFGDSLESAITLLR